jgi:Fe-S cluster assembly protein SufD
MSELMSDVTATESTWLAARRAAARGAVERLELPTFKGTPGWEFTDISGVDLDAFPATAAGDASSAPLFPDFAGRRPEPSQSLAEPVVMPLDDAAERFPDVVERHFGTIVSHGDPFVARNERDWSGGLFVYVPRGARLDQPAVATVAQEAETAVNHRTLIVLEEGAEAEVWEEWLSDGAGLFNAVTEVVVGPNARLRYVCGQALSEQTWVFGTQRAVVADHGSFEWVALGFGSARGKVRMETNLAGEGSEAKVTGAYAGHARQHLDFDTTQEHAAAHTTSDLAFRGVLAGRATAVWRGMIRVDPGAQQTDAFQESRNLLLSKRAHADAIPGLEIEANDVRCTHAAAIAQIDPEQVYYLMSRGIPRETATRLVIEGFLEELVERFEEGGVRDTLAAALGRRLERVLG